MPHLFRYLPLSAIVLAHAGPLAGQSLVLAPLVGAYAPTTSLAESTNGGGTLSQGTGIAGGVELLVLFGDGRLGFETSAALSRSAIHSTLAGAGPRSADSLATMYLLGVKGRLRLTPTRARHEVAVTAGVALAARSGPAAEQALSGLTRTGGVVGLEYRWALGEGVAFAATAEDYVYRAGVREPATQRGLTQHDLFIGIGFAIVVAGR